MTYYIITNGNSFDLVKVLPADNANFLEDYGHLVQGVGTDKLQLIHRYAANKALKTKLDLTIRPKLTRVYQVYRNHQVLHVESYYRLHAGWIPCGKRHPVNGIELTWLQQLAIAITAGASKVQLALAATRGQTGQIIYADFSPMDILL